MASITSLQDTGVLHLLLIGLLLPSVLVSGQTNTNASQTVSITNISPMATTSNPATTVYTNNGGTVTTITQSPTSTSGVSSSSTTQSPTSTSGGSSSITTQSLTSTSGVSSSSTTQSLTSTSGVSSSSTTQSLTSTSGVSSSSTTQSLTSTSKSTASSSTLSAASTSGGSSASTTQSLTSTSKGFIIQSAPMIPDQTSPSFQVTSNNGTNNMTMSNSTSNNMTSLYCRSFSCSSSDCYSMYMSRNATMCAAGYCQLLRSMDMWYTVSCSASCADSCVNSTQTNCSVNCCNSTGCLRRNFESMMMTTTMASTTTTTTTTQSASTTTSTTVDNGNKCYSGSCNGDGCYSTFKTSQSCSSSQPHCQLRKDSTNSVITWTAGCTNCTGLAACSSSTQPPCVMECCKASKTSCLMLNGTLNVLTSASRGPYLHTELILSSFCLLAVALLL